MEEVCRYDDIPGSDKERVPHAQEEDKFGGVGRVGGFRYFLIGGTIMGKIKRFYLTGLGFVGGFSMFELSPRVTPIRLELDRVLDRRVIKHFQPDIPRLQRGDIRPFDV